MQRDLKDKVVWITGAGGGMGQHIALTLSKLHSKVILSDINEQSLKKVSQKCTYDSSIKPLDITKINHVKTVVKEIESEFGQCKTSTIVTFHPAFLMRQPTQKKLAWVDLKMIRDRKTRLKI